MSTQIVDNFQINVAKPIDSRMVTTGLASRNSIQYKYEGLRVYDIIDKQAYVFIDNAWETEGAGLSSGNSGILTGTAFQMLKFTSSTTVGDSAIVDKSSNLTTPNIGIGKSPTSGIALDINGTVKSSQGFSGIGTNLTNLNGANITNSTITLNKLNPSSTDGFILKTISGVATWVSSVSDNTKITNSTSNTATNYLLFSDVSNSSSGASIFANKNSPTRLIGVKPSTSQLLSSGDNIINNEVAPGYAFSNNTTAGLYGNTTKVGLSFNSKSLLEVNNTSLIIKNLTGTTILTTNTNGIVFGSGVNNNALIKSQGIGSATSPDYTWFGDTTTGMYRPSANNIVFTTQGVNRLSISVLSTDISNNLTVTGTSTLKGNTSITGTSTLTVGTGLTTLGGALTVAGTSILTGATTLGNTLTVTGVSTLNSNLIINSSSEVIKLNSNNSNNFVSFYNNGSVSTSGYIGYFNSNNLILRNNLASGDIIFYNNNTSTPKLSILTNGYVGIGTDTPTSKFQVENPNVININSNVANGGLAFQWSTYSSYTAQFYREGSRVSIDGAIRLNDNQTWDLATLPSLMTLPVGYRPMTTSIVSIPGRITYETTAGVPATSFATYALLQLNTNGTITIIYIHNIASSETFIRSGWRLNGGTGGATNFSILYLQGINFRVS